MADLFVSTDVRTYLAANGISDPIKVGSLDEETSLSVAILHVPGLAPIHAMGPSIKQRIHLVQILVRGAVDGFAAARSLMGDVYDLLSATSGFTATRVYSKTIAVGEPAQLERADSDRPLFTATFEIWQEIA